MLGFFCSMSLFTIFTSQCKMSQMASLWFCSMSSFTTESKSDGSYYYRIKNLNSTSDFPLQNPYTLGKKGFRGTILYRIKFIPSYHLSPLQNQDLIDPKKNCLTEMILLHNQEPEFYIWFLFTKSKIHTCWAKRVSGELSFTESRLFPLTISHHCRIKIWWIQRKMVLWKWYYYRIKNLNSTIFYIWFLFTKSKAHTCWAKRVSDGFRGTILYRIKFIPSYYLKTTTESRSEDMTLRGMLY